MPKTENRPHTGERSSIPAASYHDPRPAVITWSDLQRIERAAIPLLILTGGDDADRPEVPDQAFCRACLRILWRNLSAVAKRAGRAAND